MIIEAKSLNISKLSPTIYKKFTSSLPSGVYSRSERLAYYSNSVIYYACVCMHERACIQTHTHTHEKPYDNLSRQREKYMTSIPDLKKKNSAN